jgi:hypothetical protein
MDIQKILSIAHYNICSRVKEAFDTFPERGMLCLQLANAKNFPMASVTIDDAGKIYEVIVEYHTKTRILAYRWQDSEFSEKLNSVMTGKDRNPQIAFENTLFINVSDTEILQWLEKSVNNPVNKFESALLVKKETDEDESVSYNIEFNGETFEELERVIAFRGEAPEKILKKWIKKALEAELAQSYIYASNTNTTREDR